MHCVVIYFKKIAAEVVRAVGTQIMFGQFSAHNYRKLHLLMKGLRYVIAMAERRNVQGFEFT